LFILSVDHDGQASADLQAIDGDVGGQQDEHVAAKNDVARLNGAQLADITEFGISTLLARHHVEP
jgi:hypothetical protein